MKFDYKSADRLLGEMKSVLDRVKKINNDFQAAVESKKAEKKAA